MNLPRFWAAERDGRLSVVQGRMNVATATTVRIATANRRRRMRVASAGGGWRWKLGCWRGWRFLAGWSATRWPKPCWGRIEKSNAPTADAASRAASIRSRPGRRRFARTAAMRPTIFSSQPELKRRPAADRPHGLLAPPAAAMGSRRPAASAAGERNPRQAGRRLARRVDRNPRRRRVCRRANPAKEPGPTARPGDLGA